MTRKYHPMKFTYLTPASNTYKLSFYARTISELNYSVSAQVIDQPSAEAFRTSVISFFILIVI